MTAESTLDFDESLLESEVQQYSNASPEDTSTSSTNAEGPISRLFSVSNALRALGAVLVVAAISTFMLQQWNEGGTIVRYLTLLALTATLTGAGLVCGLGIRESRGARTFLALVIVAIPIHFAVLGGLIQSQFPWDQASSYHAPWNADSPMTALWLTGLGVGALIPFTWFSVLTLVRPHARTLTWLFIVNCVPLLLPVRDTSLVALIVVAMLALFYVTDRRISEMGHAVSTREGAFVHIMMLVPVAIIIGRSIWWYELTFLFSGLVLMSCTLMYFDRLYRLHGSTKAAPGLQILCTFGAVAGWLCIAASILDNFTVPDHFVLLMLGLPTSGLLMILSIRSVTKGAGYRLAATVAATGPALANLLIFWNSTQLSVAGFGCLVVGIVFVVYGIYGQRLAALLLGSIATIGGLTQLLVAAIEIENFFHWGSLAIIGTLLIFFAALCERHARRLVAYTRTVHGQILEWEH